MQVLLTMVMDKDTSQVDVDLKFRGKEEVQALLKEASDKDMSLFDYLRAVIEIGRDTDEPMELQDKPTSLTKE